MNKTNNYIPIIHLRRKTRAEIFISRSWCGKCEVLKPHLKMINQFDDATCKNCRRFFNLMDGKK